MAVSFYGHTHRPTVGRFGATLLFNPGSAGPKRFMLPRGIGLQEIKDKTMSSIHSVWRPTGIYPQDQSESRMLA